MKRVRYAKKIFTLIAIVCIVSFLSLDAFAQQSLPPIQPTTPPQQQPSQQQTALPATPAPNNPAQGLPSPLALTEQAPSLSNVLSSAANATGIASSSEPNPASDAEAVQLARDQAFNQLALNTLPMTPDQIQKLRNLFADSQRAASASPGAGPPKPVASSQMVTLSPGLTPPIVRLAQGYVTAIVFLDSTGAPWPIEAYDVGNPSAFNVQWNHNGNILMIQSSAMYTMGNLVVQLKGLNTPVLVTLIPGQPIVDYRVDMRVPALGPNAKPGAQTSLPQAASNVLINVLDGVPPENSKTLTVPNSSSQAWLAGDQIYLRTPLTLLSPAWIAAMSSADGTNAYQIPKAPSILVADSDGKIFNLRIEGY